MNTGEVVNLHVALLRLKEITNPNQPYPVKFSYAAALNLTRTKDIFETYKSVADPTTIPSYVTYEELRKQLAEEMCEKNEDGTPLVANNQYVLLPAVRANYDKELLKIKDQLPTFDDDMKAHEARVLELNDVPTDVRIHMIKIDHLPTELPISLMDGLQYMIKDDDE